MNLANEPSLRAIRLPLGELKSRLLSAVELSDVYDFFRQHIAEDPAFLSGSAPFSNLALSDNVARMAVTSLCLRETVVAEICLFRLEGAGLTHGTVHLGRRHHALFLLFDDVGTGFMAAGDDRGPCRFVRLMHSSTRDHPTRH